jgi:hypothetical protein
MKKFAYLTFFTGLLLSGIAAFFSVVGLSMIFAGSFTAVAILASSLEITKLVAVSWLYRYRSLASRPVRSYFYIATIILMIITSLGIFGYLSRAHVDIEAESTQAQLTLDEINQREQAITANRDQLTKELNSVSSQSDKLVDQLGASNRLTRENGAVQVQRENAKRRETILNQLKETNDSLTAIKKERIVTQSTVSKATADIGPLRYVASALYGNENQDTIRKAVIALTVLLMIVFDPMAIMLLIAANILFLKVADEDEILRTKQRTPEILPLLETIPPEQVIKEKQVDKIADNIATPSIESIPEPVIQSVAQPKANVVDIPKKKRVTQKARKSKPLEMPKLDDMPDPTDRSSEFPKGLKPETIIEKVRRNGWSKNNFLKKEAARLVDSGR